MDEENPAKAKELKGAYCWPCRRLLEAGQQIAIADGWKIHAACLSKALMILKTTERGKKKA